MTELLIGEVARLLEMTVEGLRFYERQGLVEPRRRTAAGYRLYGRDEIATLRFLRSAQEMGFSLREVRELLDIRRGEGDSCPDMRARLVAKLGTVRRRQELLESFERDLEESIRRCDTQIASGRTDCCPVLDDLGANLPAE